MSSKELAGNSCMLFGTNLPAARAGRTLRFFLLFSPSPLPAGGGEGGPIGLVRDGDNILVDADRRILAMTDVSDEEIRARRREFVPRPYKATNGTLWKFIKNVSSASEGCVTDGGYHEDAWRQDVIQD